jgi:hypothetical protein
MFLSDANLITLRSFARAQAERQRATVADIAQTLRVQSVTQPNSRSTVQLHAVAAQALQTAKQFDRVGGGR